MTRAELRVRPCVGACGSRSTEARAVVLARLVLLAIPLLAASCAEQGPARDQFVVAIDTDAPAPRLVDRLRIDVLAEDDRGALALACEACSREIAIDAETSWPISLGVPATLGGELFLRARLFPAGRVLGEQPRAETTLDRVVRLVSTGAGIERRRALLPFRCAGLAASLASRESCGRDASMGAIEDAAIDDGAPSLVGTVEDGLTGPCVGEPSPDTGLFDADVCVRGGAFWMGNLQGIGFGPGLDGVPEHAAMVPSFYMDVYEFTAARLDAIDRTTLDVPIPAFATGGESCANRLDAAQPMACVVRDTAAVLCAAYGRRLPTEAEREWAAGGGARESRYPWGDDYLDCPIPGPPPTCIAGPGPIPVAVGLRLDAASPEGIFDLSGNVAEWTADRFERYDEPCWQPGLYDVLSPWCEPRESDAEPLAAARGGSPSDGGPFRYPAAARQALSAEGRYPTIGFRCVR